MTKLWLMVRLAMALGIVALPAVAQGRPENDEFSVSNDELTSQSANQSADVSIASEPPRSVAEMPSYPEMEQPATTLSEWMAQIEASIIQIVGIRVEETETGLQVVLETAEGELAAPTTTISGNAAIAEIPNAVLALPEGDSFEQFEPAEGIALVQVTNIPGVGGASPAENQVRVAITGTDAPPVVEVTATGLAVTLGEAIVNVEDETIQIVVTGQEDEGYNPSSASTATRTDTPLRDIPQSIQVVPRQVIEDRNVRTLTEAVETVSGVVDGGGFYGAPSGGRIIRGFDAGLTGGAASFRNGFRDAQYGDLVGIGTVERVEVLKGPGSVLFGQVEPGGIINVITRQPLSEPYYEVALEVGNYGFYQPSVDLSGPLDSDGNVLYRFISSYQSSENVQPFFEPQVTTIAPSITVNFGDRTELDLYYEYVRYFADDIRTDAVALSDGSLTPRDFYVGYPSLNFFDITTQRYGYSFNHEFNDNLRLRNNLAVTSTITTDERGYGIGLVDDRFIQIESFFADSSTDNYFGQIDLVGEFETGSISHQVLVGFDFNRLVNPLESFQVLNVPNQDIFDSNYDFTPNDADIVPAFKADTTTQSYGVYLQDQITFTDNLKFLVGGRYDWISYENEIADFGLFGNTDDDPIQNDNAFSPRIGLVYQPSDEISLYASYSESFRQATGFNPDGRAFEPTQGTQYEAGVRGEFLDGRLSANLAAYNLTRTNIVVPDLNNPGFSTQIGEARSRGIELDIAGEILSGWNIIASYAYTDTEITRGIPLIEGNQLRGAPEHQASLWTTYEIQEGDLSGLGFGLGLFYVGERQGDDINSFQVDGYLRTDAALYYRSDRLNAAINIRNLFDVDYISVPFRQSAVQRGEPFTVVGSVSWEF